MKLRWRVSLPAAIVVLDGASESTETLSPLFAGEPFIALESRSVFCVLTPLILIKSIWYFLRSKSVQVAYVAALLSCIKPKIVVTFIDNSLLFQRVAALLHGSIRFLAIQNGVRMLSRDNPLGAPRVFHSEFVCIGERDVDEYRKHGAEVGFFYPIGSLKDSYFRAVQPTPPKKKRFDLCLISQIKQQHYRHYPKTMESLELLARHLKRFCETNNVSLCVAARRHPNGKADLFDWETQWFRDRLGGAAEIIPNDTTAFTSYALVDASRVTLALHTTLIHEGFGRGNRTLSCNFTGDGRYDFPIPGIWSLTDTSYEAFEERLLALLEMSDVEYSELLGKWPNYLIGYQAQCPTHIFLKQLIASAVAGKPAPFVFLPDSENLND